MFNYSSQMENPYGICNHINRTGNRYEYDTRQQDLLMIKKTGATWIRTDWDWTRMVTKEKSVYSFTHFDQMMESVDSLQLNALAIITLRLQFHKSDQEEWKDFLTQQVKHFQQVKYWELINEVDRIRSWNPNIYAMDYVELLKIGYQAVKNGNKKAKVLFSGIANTDSEYLDSILGENVANYFDIMNVHRYNQKSSEPEELLAYFQRLYEKLNKYNIDKPLWLTECGCSTAEGWATEITQSNRLPRIFLISFACGIDKVFWFKSRSNEFEHQDWGNGYFGLWHKDYMPKPAYYAYQTLTKMCPNQSTRPKLVRHGNVYMASWKRPDGKKAWALWTSKKEESARLDIKGHYKVYNNQGKEINDIIPSDIKITPSVKYFIGANNVMIIDR